jgi:two-component system chemotaxis response regulator CheB
MVAPRDEATRTAGSAAGAGAGSPGAGQEPCLTGRLGPLELPLIFSVLEMGQLSGRLEVRSSAGNGLVLFRRGAVVAAEYRDLAGEVAALATLAFQDGSFEFRCGEPATSHGIERSNQGLCLEAMRLVDESQRCDALFERCQPEAPDRIEPAHGRVLSVLVRPLDLAGVASRCSLPRPATLYFLEQLEERGAVRRRSAGAGTDAAAAAGRQTEDAAGEAADGPPKVRVLLVDDSKLMQKVLTKLYESDPGVVVAGVAENGEEALEKLRELKPDLVSLDLYMPVMDGVTTLKRIMLSQPTPTMIVTSANPDDLDRTFESILRFGAIDFITKPAKHRGGMDMQADNILSRLHKAAKVNLRGIRMVQPPPRRTLERAYRGECRGILTAVAGTGGCLSYMQLLTGLPTDLPLAVVGLLDFPEDFLRAFVTYLRKCSAFDVQLATDGASLFGGVCYLASSADRVRIRRGPRGPVLRLSRERAAPGELLMDGAAVFDERSVALMLSGEGEAALPGLAAVRAAGGLTMAQLPESCVDPEQPRLAIESGLVDRVVLLPRLFGELSQILMSRLRRGRLQADLPSVELSESESSWPRMSA